MFKDKTYLADVAIELDIRTDTVLKFHADYLRPVQMDGLFKLYNDLKNDFNTFFYFYRRIKKEQLLQQDIINLIKGQKDLNSLKTKLNFIFNISKDNNCKSSR
jgi:hypothetical protein